MPVRVYSAVHEHKLQFHLVHEKDDGPIGYEKVCKLEDKPVGNDEIVKAFEYKKGELVHLTDEDFEAVQVEGQHTIDLEDFVPYEDIDPTFFAHTYLVGPQDGAEKTYALLVRAMEESGLAGIGKFVMRNRQYLGCLRVRDRTLTLEQLLLRRRGRSAVRDRARAGCRRSASASSTWRSTSSRASRASGSPRSTRTPTRDALRALVKAKLNGKDIHRAPEAKEDEVPDLMEALRRSVEQAERGNEEDEGEALSQNERGHGPRAGRRRALRSRSRRVRQAADAPCEGAARVGKRRGRGHAREAA